MGCASLGSAAGALVDISAIKLVAPNVLQKVIDAAIQIHGGDEGNRSTHRWRTPRREGR